VDVTLTQVWTPSSESKSLFANGSVALISIFGSKAYADIGQMKEYFKAQKNKDLDTVIDVGFEGKQPIKEAAFKHALLALCVRPDVRDARYIYSALKKIVKVDDDVLNEIFITRTPQELTAIASTYPDTTLARGATLAAQIASQISGNTPYERALLNLLKDRKDGNVDTQIDELFNAGENKLDGTDEAKFIEILTTCSHAHALNLSAAYKAKYGSSLEDIIADEFDSRLELRLKNLLTGLVVSTEAFIAKKLAETKDPETINRLIICNREIPGRLQIIHRLLNETDILPSRRFLETVLRTQCSDNKYQKRLLGAIIANFQK